MDRQLMSKENLNDVSTHMKHLYGIFFEFVLIEIASHSFIIRFIHLFAILFIVLFIIIIISKTNQNKKQTKNKDGLR